MIFSTDQSVRLSRHILFWLSWFLYLSCTQLRNQTPDEVGWNPLWFINWVFRPTRPLTNAVLLSLHLFAHTKVLSKKEIPFLFNPAVTTPGGYVLGYIYWLLIYLDRSQFSPFFWYPGHQTTHALPGEIFRRIQQYTLHGNLCGGQHNSRSGVLQKLVS
jgi:hypothetical protein